MEIGGCVVETSGIQWRRKKNKGGHNMNPIELAIAKLEAFYMERGADLSLADTFLFFDSLAKIKEAAGK